MKSAIVNALKGFAMGAANVVPGVSGGTIALVTGIYSRIIAAISSLASIKLWKLFFKGKFAQWWKAIDGSFLLALGIGIVLSILSLAKFLTWTLAAYPVLTWAFFFGLIVASAIYMLIPLRNWRFVDVLWLVLGLGIGLAFCFLTPSKTPETAWFYFLTGALAMCTMILPGVSGSFIMQILGKYDTVLAAIDLSAPNWSVLLPLALGAVIGIVAFAKFLKWLLARFERQTMLLLVGFVLGTLIKVWPWSNMEAVEAAGKGLQIGGAVLFLFLGIALVVGIQVLSSRKKS
ncbi:MAG: DUF368 domain-containing protein [Candidatus Cryptobacteroides sp.]